MLIDVGSFTGLVPRSSADQLPPNAAQLAVNCNFNTGSVTGIRQAATYGSYNHGAPIKGGLAWYDADGTRKLYTYSYDVDAVRSPIPDDVNKRFYWTGENGSTTEFRFGLAEANGGSNYVGPVTSSYKVGVINSSQWDGAMASVGIHFEVRPKDPPVSMSALTDSVGKAWIADGDGNLVREISSSVASFVGTGTSVNGWYRTYTVTLSSSIDAFAQQTVSSTTYRQVTARVSLSSYGTGSATANLWYVGSSLHYIELIGTVPTEFAAGYVLGDTVQVFNVTAGDTGGLIPGEVGIPGYASLGTMYLKSTSQLSYNNSDFPAGLGVATVANASPDEAYLAFEWSFNYNGQRYRAVFHENKLLSDTLDIGDSITGSLVRNSTTNFTLNVEFGTDGLTEVRSYIMTFVNQLGEESEPSEPIEITLNNGREVATMVLVESTWAAKLADAAMLSGRYPLHGVRLYRTVPSSSGDSDFLYAFTVKGYETEELPGENYMGYGTSNPYPTPTTGVYNIPDKVPAAGVGSACATQDYIRDTSELQSLQGLISINNGMLAAFKSNEIWVCEPGKPWAWKGRAIYTLPSRVISLVAHEQGFYVLTATGPHYFSGSLPETMVGQRLPSELACLNKRAACSIGDTMIFLSGDGPVHVSGMQAQIDAAFNREVWRDEYGDNAVNGSMQLAAWGNRVIAYYPGAGNSFLYDVEDRSWVRSNVRIDYAVTAPAGAIQTHDALIFGDAGYYWKIFGGAADTELWQWQSKNFPVPKPLSFGVFMISGTGTATVKVYADGVLKHTSSVLTLSPAGTVHRLPSGFLAAKWSLLIEAQSINTELLRVMLASSPAELQNA